MLETPLLRVSRPVAACSRCRATKVKCDGKLPACTACERSNRASECSATNDQFARGKERSYVATLETKVERLEKKISEARARRKTSTVHMADTLEPLISQKSPTTMAKSVQAIGRRTVRQKEASDIDELVSGFGLLAVNATARDFYGFSKEMSYARLLQSASAKESLPAGLTKDLPPRFATNSMVQHYLRGIFTLLPVFEEAVLYASVDAIYHQNGEFATAWDRFCVRMILAVACISQSRHQGDAQYVNAVHHVHAAMADAEQVLHPGYISSIQALVLWTIYATMDPYHFDSWTLIGAASRAMVDLGMHQDPSRNTIISRTKIDLRRRVYWCVYALDRSTSMVQTRAFSFSDEAAHVSFPFHMPSSLAKHSSPESRIFRQSFDTALSLFRIRQVQSEWYMTLFQSSREPWQNPYPYIWKQYARMTDWFQEMPQKMLPEMRQFLKLELLYSYIYLLSPSPRIPHTHKYAQHLVFEHCTAYATSLMTILQQSMSTINLPITSYDAIRAYMTGQQLVNVLTCNLDAILDSRPPIPPTPGDALAPPLQVDASLLSSTRIEDGRSRSSDRLDRALGALSDFTLALSNLGLKFGLTHLRDHFQSESASISTQLCQRRFSSQSAPSLLQQSSPSLSFPQ